MTMTRWTRAALALGTGAVLAVTALAAEYTITVKEQLNRAYGRELVTYPFAAKTGECVAASLQVKGPGGPAPAQLTAVELYPNTQFVKAATLAFVTEPLAALATQTYTVTYGAKAAAAASDLKVTTAKDSVELASAGIGVRLPLGEKTYDPPAAVAAVPGPLTAMRLSGAAYAGGSALTGEVAVKAWRGAVTENGPALARVVQTYTLADGNVITFAATLIAGDNTVRWDLHVAKDAPALGVAFRLPPVPGVAEALLPKGYGQWARADRKVKLNPGAEPFAFLTPDTSLINIFPDCPPMIRLAPPAPAGGGAVIGTELYLCSRDPGAWVDPIPLTYAGVKIWELESIEQMWQAWKRKRLPVAYAADGTVTVSASFAAGGRRWWTAAGTPAVGDELTVVKDQVLDWPADPKRPSPRVYVGMPEIQDVWTRAAADAELKKTLGGQWGGGPIALMMKPAAERKPAEIEAALSILRKQLALLGNFDVMRYATGTVALYDVLIGSDLLTPADRQLFRAQMAFLGYLMADPRCWDMERGYNSGNPNMSCSYTLSLGVIAGALSDHPRAKAWSDRATAWMDKWLTDEVGPNGEWIPEGSHYSYVSFEPLLVYALAARRAGFHDFTGDPRLHKLVAFFAKHNTPRDTQRGGKRSIAAFGRGHGGFMPAFGLAAVLFKDAAPELSRTCQWLWAESGYPGGFSDTRLGGLEGYILDRRLPAAAPAWASEQFPTQGPILRHAFNTPQESFVLCLTSDDAYRNLDVWTPEVGGIAQWFGRGQPLSTCFTFAVGYNERHELLRNGVRLARNWGAPDDAKKPFGHYTKTRAEAFAALPPADYVRSTFVNVKVDDRDWFPEKVPAFPVVKPATGTNLEWTRQILFLKDPNPAGPAWLLLRDTTSGGQPTVWQFWTLSEKVGTTEQAKDATAFLADKPGEAIVPVRELPVGARYTALGQCGVDVEYFVASPAATPRHTLRYGGMGQVSRVPEWQDLLHLQQPGDGAYCVAVFPRPRAEAAPAFAALADGKLVKVSGAFGADYALLATAETEAAADDVRVKGTAAAVQVRVEFMRLALGAPGSVNYRGTGLTTTVGGASLTVDGAKTLTLALATPWAGGEVTLMAMDGYALDPAAKGVTLTKPDKTSYTLAVPAGTAEVRLVKAK